MADDASRAAAPVEVRLLTETGQLALVAAQRGARAVIEGARVGFAVSTKTSSRDLVTDVDRATEAAIVRFIQHHRPADAVLGEETGTHAGNSATRWIIDPIDGTANFAHGRSDFAVAVAAEIDGHPRIGAIVRPTTGEWVVCDETGATARSDPSRGVSRAAALQESLLSVSVSIDESRRPVTMAVLASLLPRIQDFRRTGSTSCDLLAIATGALDAYVGVGTKPWDIAAGWAIVSAAGGRCRRFPIATGHEAFLIGSSAVVAELESTVAAAARLHVAARATRGPARSSAAAEARAAQRPTAAPPSTPGLGAPASDPAVRSGRDGRRR